MVRFILSCALWAGAAGGVVLAVMAPVLLAGDGASWSLVVCAPAAVLALVSVLVGEAQKLIARRSLLRSGDGMTNEAEALHAAQHGFLLLPGLTPGLFVAAGPDGGVNVVRDLKCANVSHLALGELIIAAIHGALLGAAAWIVATMNLPPALVAILAAMLRPLGKTRVTGDGTRWPFGYGPSMWVVPGIRKINGETVGA